MLAFLFDDQNDCPEDDTPEHSCWERPGFLVAYGLALMLLIGWLLHPLVAVNLHRPGRPAPPSAVVQPDE